MHLISYMDEILPIALLIAGAAATLCLFLLGFLAFRKNDTVMGWCVCSPSWSMANAAGVASILLIGGLYYSWGGAQLAVVTGLASVWILVAAAGCYHLSLRCRITSHGISLGLLDPASDVDWEEIQDYAYRHEKEGIRYTLVCRKRGLPDHQRPVFYRMELMVPPEKHDEFEKIVSYKTATGLGNQTNRPMEQSVSF